MICLTITCSCTLLIRKVEHVLSCTLHSLHSTFDPNWDKATKFFLTSAKGEFEGPKSDSPNFTWFDFYKVKYPFFFLLQKNNLFFHHRRKHWSWLFIASPYISRNSTMSFKLKWFYLFFRLNDHDPKYIVLLFRLHKDSSFFRLREKTGLEHSQLNSYDHKDSSWSIEPTCFC